MHFIHAYIHTHKYCHAGASQDTWAITPRLASHAMQVNTNQTPETELVWHAPQPSTRRCKAPRNVRHAPCGLRPLNAPQAYKIAGVYYITCMYVCMHVCCLPL